MDRQEIFAQIDCERAYQDKTWGSEFDNKNTVNDWIAYIVKYLGNAITAAGTRPRTNNIRDFRLAILKIATLCVCILEREDYAKRHYDE